jgi:mitotic spindle assembly checkpoint protein MAD1
MTTSSSQLLREVHRETSAFLLGRLPELLPSYVSPAVREGELKTELEALRAQLPAPLGNKLSHKRSRLALEGSARLEGGDSSPSLSDVLRLKAELEEATAARERDAQRHALALDEAESVKAKLERQLRFLLAEEEAAQSMLKSKQKEWMEEKLDLQASLRSERDRAHALEEELLGASEATEKTRREFGAATPGGQSRWLSDENERLKDEVKALRVALTQIRAAKEEEETLHASSERRRSEDAKRTAEVMRSDTGTVSDEARQLRVRCRELERLLRRREQNIADMEEEKKSLGCAESEVDSLRLKVAMQEKDLQGFRSASEAHRAVLEEKEQWSAMFRKLLAGTPDLQGNQDASPLVALQFLRRTQQESIALTSQVSQWEARATQTADRLRLARSEAATEASRRSALEEEVEELKAKEERLRRRTSTLERELNAAKEMISSLESLPRRGGRGDVATQKALEEALEAAKEELETLQSAAVGQTPQAVLAKSRSRVRELEASLERAEQERDIITKDRDSIMKQLERVEKELSQYEHQVVTGDYDKRTTKVLHFTNNPTAIALARSSSDRVENEMAQLRLENDRLSQEVEVLREGATDAVKAAAAAAAKARAEGIDKDKVNQRLKEMFKERIQFFREGVYLLTGFKIDMTSDRDSPQLRLRSMYADNESDHLLFQWEPDGLQLMETPFASRLDSKIFTYLSTCNSVPAFLSNLTLELFEKQTWQGP